LSLFLFSDPHFGHKNIIEYEKRPFINIEDMDKKIILNWNRVVKSIDKVIVAGDISFYNRDKTEELVRSLNGEKILIRGNHDKAHSESWWRKIGFNTVVSFPMCIHGFFWVSHEPMYMNESMPYVNIHGHTHSMKFDSDRYYNISAECIGYTPINVEEILKLYKVEELHNKEGEDGQES
jgi:calcineurin-like phosphoesterase family protein